MSAINRVTFIIHTYNRPEFLIRLVRYFDSVDSLQGVRVIIADGSDDRQAEPFDQWLAGHEPRFDLSLERHPGTTLMDRLGMSLAMVDTPYVILGADDDFYMFEWINLGVAMMDEEPDIGAIFGQFMTFCLPKFVPWGVDAVFDIPKTENPPLPWLEGATVAHRLEALKERRMGLASAGWYALQRTCLLSLIVEYGQRFKLEATMFERFMVIAQAATAKTRMIDELFIVRQVDGQLSRDPFGYRENMSEVSALLACCESYLIDRAGFSKKEARTISLNVMTAEIDLMKVADSKRLLRKLANLLPFLRPIWRSLRPLPTTDVLRDSRLPPPPFATQFKVQKSIVERAISADFKSV